MTTYLTRHGQDKDNALGILNGHRDNPLTPRGEAQAQELGAGIKKLGLRIHKVYSTPLQRGYRTASMVAEILGLPPPTVLQGLIERDFGPLMTGKFIADIRKYCPEEHILQAEKVTYFLEAPFSENYPALYRRMGRVLAHVKNLHPAQDENILLVGHHDSCKFLYGVHYNIPWKETLTHFHFGNCELVALDEGPAPLVPHIITIEQHNV